MARIEDFELDHNTVKAPYVRSAGTEQNGDALAEKYDLRFLQPDKDALPTSALHTSKHLLAVNIRDELKEIIDILPVGCHTSFCMIMWDQHSPQEIRDVLINILDKITNTEVVPAVSAKECGNYRNHSLFAAEEYAKIVLDRGISLDPFERIL